MSSRYKELGGVFVFVHADVINVENDCVFKLSQLLPIVYFNGYIVLNHSNSEER